MKCSISRLFYTFLFILSVNATASLREAFPKPIAQATYQLKDLEALEKNNNYQEFFAHALDIKPSQRDEYWQKMVTSVAESMATDSIKLEQFNEQQTRQMLSLMSWPLLSNNEFFRYRSDQYIVQSLKQCTRHPEKFPAICLELYQQFLKAEPHYNFLLELIPIAYKWSKDPRFLSTPNITITPSPLAITLLAAKNELSEFYCAKTPYYQIITEWILDQRPGLKVVKDKLHPDCWERFSQTAVNELAKVNQHNEYLFALLDKDKKIPRDTKDFLLVKGYFNQSFKDPIYKTMAQNHLKLLSQSHSRREKTLHKISRLTFLPDKIFKQLKPDTDSQLLNHIDHYFPEFMSLYAKTCLNYYQGQGEHQKGNPTLHCRYFFESLSHGRLKNNPVYRSYSEKFKKITNDQY